MTIYSKNLNSIKWQQLKNNCSDYVKEIAINFFDELLKQQDSKCKVLASTLDAYNKAFQLNTSAYMEYLELVLPQGQFNQLIKEL